MVDSKENYKFDLGVKGLIKYYIRKLKQRECIYRSLLNFATAFTISTVAEKRSYDGPTVSSSGSSSCFKEPLPGFLTFSMAVRN